MPRNVTFVSVAGPPLRKERRAILKVMPVVDPTPRLAIDPKSVKINLTAGTGVEIEWKDGHRSSYTFPFLRDACPCALCDDEREKSGRKPGEAFQPIRIAVTGSKVSPGLFESLELLGKEESLARLRAAAGGGRAA